MISEQLLQEVTSDSTFNKGKKLFQQGCVYVDETSENRISGVVEGTYHYHVSIKKSDDFYDLNCSCPAFDYQDVCKHCVALALAYNQSQNNDASTPYITKTQQLKQFIDELPQQKLAAALFELINNDSKLYKKWTTKAQLATNDNDVKSLQKLITKSLPLKDIWEYHKVAEYFDNAKSNIDNILELAQRLTAGEQLQLVMKIFERLSKVLERVDDSGGYRFDLLALLSSSLPQLLTQQNWHKQQKIQWLYQLLQLSYEGVPEIPNAFALSDDELDAFFELCQQKFDNIDVATDIAQREDNFQLQQLGDLLISNRPNDFDFILKVQSKMASSFQDILHLSQLCLDNDDELTAEDWLVRAKTLIVEPYEKSNWQEQAVKVYAKLGETKQAWKIAWLQFTEKPSFNEWQRLQQQIKLIKWQPNTLKEDVETSLIAACENNRIAPLQLAAIHNLIAFYFSEQHFEKGCELIDKHGTDEITLSKASYQLATILPEKAIIYASKYLDKTLIHASNRHYEEAVMLLTSLDEKLPQDDTIKEKFQTLVRATAEKNRRRPNMMKLMNESLSEYL